MTIELTTKRHPEAGANHPESQQLLVQSEPTMHSHACTSPAMHLFMSTLGNAMHAIMHEVHACIFTCSNTFLAEVLKHSKQMYGDKANESTEPEEEEAGEILTGDKKRKHSPIVWDPESKVQRTSQPQGIYERALHEAAELKLMQQQEEESDDGPLMKGSPVLSESEGR